MKPTAIDLATGVTIEYVEQGDTPGAIPMIFLHSIADSRRMFEPLMARLPASIRAIAPSQRGHGDAGRPPTGYRPEDFADDLEAFMNALELDAAVLVGGSSGGHIARRFAIDHPVRTNGLVFLGSPYRLDDKPGVREMWDATFSRLSDPIDPVMVREFGDQTIGSAVPREVFEMLIAENLKAAAHVWVGTMRGLIEDRTVEELDRIEAPTLILWGDQDPILSREDQEMMASRIPDAKLVVYPGGGHVFYLEDPESVAAELAAFATMVGQVSRPGDGATSA